MAAEFPHTAEQRVVAGSLLGLVVGTAFPQQADLCRLLGVPSGTVSNWMSGERMTPMQVFLAVWRAAAARAPERTGALVEAFAEQVLGLRGRWHTFGEIRTGTSVPDELLDVHEKLANLRARYAAANSDGTVDAGEAGELLDALRTARKEFDELEATVNGTIAAARVQ
jgi:transcriptional regulator with XRE-family HTH domain